MAGVESRVPVASAPNAHTLSTGGIWEKSAAETPWLTCAPGAWVICGPPPSQPRSTPVNVYGPLPDGAAVTITISWLGVPHSSSSLYGYCCGSPVTELIVSAVPLSAATVV